MTPQIGYCTNVHAGPDLEQTRANLQRYALEVKHRFSPNAPMGVGLWLAASAARGLRDRTALDTFASWLRDVGLVPFTLNGFPHGDFHKTVVKHDVYLPTWWQPARLEYTLDLIAIQDALLPPGMMGSISTLPIAWDNPPTHDQLAAAGQALRKVAAALAALEKEHGRLICLSLEPEPGCVLQRSADVIRYFQDHLLGGDDEAAVRRYLRVCHDVCHAAVMFEDQADVLNRYRSAGIGVGKVQVSAAVAAPLERMSPDDRQAAIAQLAEFREERYLHQTMVRPTPDAPPTFYEDLPAAIASAPPQGDWRVHFHVPIYLERFGRLEATQQAILQCLDEVKKHNDTTHFEVETYAWGVLPAELQQPDLAAGIAQEMAWFRTALG